MRTAPIFLAFAAAAFPVGLSALVTPAEARPVFVNAQISEAAVGGYDVVSYFRGNGLPVKGTKQFSVDYDGAVYYFSTSENATAFKAAPAKFTPQYGGHCA